ncbi:Reticulon-like protein [Plasmodiophora brassicae]|nr:hypothetical protein PBRA_006700 [Plasmodiophora brassicae]
MASAVSGRAAQYAADGHGAAPVAEQVRILAADLVMWRHPAVSGVTLAACLIAYYLLYWRAMTALTLVAITALLQMLVLFIMRFVQRVAAAKSSAPDILVEDMEIISATWLSSHSAELSAALNAAANAWRRICLFQSPALTYRVVVVLVAVALVGCILDLLNLFLISVLAAFTVPRVYASRRPVFDKYIARARSKFDSIVVAQRASNTGKKK